MAFLCRIFLQKGGSDIERVVFIVYMFYMGSARRKGGAGLGRARAEGIDDLVTACPSVECCADR